MAAGAADGCKTKNIIKLQGGVPVKTSRSSSTVATKALQSAGYVSSLHTEPNNSRLIPPQSATKETRQATQQPRCLVTYNMHVRRRFLNNNAALTIIYRLCGLLGWRRALCLISGGFSSSRLTKQLYVGLRLPVCCTSTATSEEADHQSIFIPLVQDGEKA